MLKQIERHDAGSPILTLRGVRKRFGHISVLNGVNAEVRSGEVTAFVGPNGAGKTTLFHTISGDLKLDAGTVTLSGRAINGLPPWMVARMGLGKQFQDVRTFGALSCQENVLLALNDHESQSPIASLVMACRHSRQLGESRERANQFLSMVGLDSQASEPANTLSSGNQKLLALARLLAGGFPILLLDEPAAGVSPATLSRILSVLHDAVRRDGRTVVLIEHNMSFVAELADTTYVLKDGIVFDVGPTREVLARPQNRELCIGI
jgi:ABC-type branched-subunit amino acid transport system ATPase component